MIIKVNNLTHKSLINKSVAIGYFDLIHKQHANILLKADTCITFINITKKNNDFNDIKTRVENIKSLGVKKLYIIDINLFNMEANDFYNKYLISAKKIIVGADFKFGSDQKSINDFLDKKNIEVIEYDKNVSTTKIKSLLLEGNIKAANDLLYENFHIQNIVVEGNKIGRKLGFNTANFKIQKINLKQGVYLTKTIYKNKVYKSITFFGIPKTIKENNELVMETHIIDFNKMIYNKYIDVIFYDLIGEIKKYDSEQELIKAITNFKQIAINNNY